MTPSKFVRDSFSHYWKQHLGLLVGVFLTSAILTGSLLVGDSVRSTLGGLAAKRLSKINTAVLGGDRWFSSILAKEVNAAPLIMSVGSIAVPSGEARVNGAQILGVSEEFWKLSALSEVHKGFGLNEEAARRLKVKLGDIVVLRLELPSLISRDAPLSGETNQEVTLRKTIDFIADADHHGSFQLAASQQAVPTAYVELSELQASLEKPNQVNAMFSATDLSQTKWFSQNQEKCEVAIGDVQKARLQAAMKTEGIEVPGLLDFGLEIQKLEGEEASFALRTQRVFLDETLSTKILNAIPEASPVLTYMVNSISSPGGKTPYSMVTSTPEIQSWVEGGIAENEAVISQWLAEDQNLKVGDALEIRYFTVGVGREIIEKTAIFNVKYILPQDSTWLKPSWTPNFPGVSEAANCRDWQPGMPVQLDAIREVDEAYWDKYGTTPKVFITLEAGQEMWSNRFGNLTGVRFNNFDLSEKELSKKILETLRLSDIGLRPVDLKALSQSAAKGSVDFGGLFIGLSLFLIAGALLFAALLFIFTLEKRASQFGLMLALGLTLKKIRNLVLVEALLITVVGAALGLLGGVVYTKLAIYGLNEQWKDATVGLSLRFDHQSTTYGIAFLTTLFTAWLTLRVSLRGLFKTPPKSLLAGDVASGIKDRKKIKSSLRRGAEIAIWMIGALALAIAASKSNQPEMQAGLFFGAGFMVLLAGLSSLAYWLHLSAVKPRQFGDTTLAQLGLRNLARRPMRSLSVIGILAGGVFLVIAVNAFRLSSSDSSDGTRQTGTGGFTFVADSTLPIYEDLNTEAAAEQFALDEKLLTLVKWVPFRQKDGDDASCLNLNRAQMPVLTGVNPQYLKEVGAFKFVSGGWSELIDDNEEIITAVADQATAMWGLGKGVGDLIEYQDAGGKTFTVKLVGLLGGSLLQGKILISEQNFLAKYPNAAGYQFFLVDAPRDQAQAISAHLVRQLESRGLSLELAGDRLNRFYAVQNTYIGIFTLLGGLGVLLGTVGLAVLAMRNVMDRRGEFALMQAIGFGVPKLRGMVLSEHLALLGLGVLLGVVSAALAIWPSLQHQLHDVPYGVMLGVVIGILVFGSLVCYLATKLALQGKLTQNLRAE